MNLQLVADSGLCIVHLRNGSNTGGQVSTSAVQFLRRLQITGELKRVCILPGLEMDERLQFLDREHSVIGPLDLREFVLTPRSDRELDVNNGFLRTLVSYFGLGIGEGCFEVASFEINGKKIFLRLHSKYGAQVFLTLKILGCGLKQRRLSRR